MRKTLALALLATLTTGSFAQTIYSTGFESPTFNGGDIVGQDGWTTALGGSDGTIQSGTVSSGSQALQLSSDNTLEGSWWFRPLNYDASGKVIDISWDMMVDDSDTASGGFGIDIYDNQAAEERVTALTVDGSGVVLFGDGQDIVATAAAVNMNEWNSYRLRLDYNTHTVDVFLNGTLVGNGDLNPFANDVLGDADAWITNGGFNNGFYDNLSVQAVPEPASLAALGIGIAAIVSRRRKSAK